MTKFTDRFIDAAIDAEDLSTVEFAVLVAYARHCDAGSTVAWLTVSRLMEAAKIRSRSVPSKTVQSLVRKGWLVRLAPDEWPSKQTPAYALEVPTVSRGETVTVSPNETSGGQNRLTSERKPSRLASRSSSDTIPSSKSSPSRRATRVGARTRESDPSPAQLEAREVARKAGERRGQLVLHQGTRAGPPDGTHPLLATLDGGQDGADLLDQPRADRRDDTRATPVRRASGGL